YRAVAFPHEWEREAVLLEDIDAADATLLLHDGRLWLFAAVAAANASSLDELHIFGAETIRGPWHPHPCNPVVSDVRCARPAGPIQCWEERLVRPGQDGSRPLGWAHLIPPDRRAQPDGLRRARGRPDRAGRRLGRARDARVRGRQPLRGDRPAPPPAAPAPLA